MLNRSRWCVLSAVIAAAPICLSAQDSTSSEAYIP